MPRGLSLKKKPPQPGKEQLSITTFFKNASEKKLLQPTCSYEHKEITQPTKRKASSPIPGNRNKLMAESSSNGCVHNAEERIPLIEIVDSRSNSPPVVISSNDESDSKSQSSKVNPDTKDDFTDAKSQHKTKRNIPAKIKSPGKQVRDKLNLVQNRSNNMMQNSVEKKESPEKNNIVFDKDTSPSITNRNTPKACEILDGAVIIEKNSTVLPQSPLKPNVSPSKLLKTPKKTLKSPSSDLKNGTHFEDLSKLKDTKLINENSIPLHVSPKKLETVPRRSPRKLKCSPSKNIVQVQVMELNGKKLEPAEMDTLFNDEWCMDDIQEVPEVEDLDLSSFQRCEIVSITHKSESCSEIKLKDFKDKKATCIIEGIWNTLPLRVGDTVSALAARAGGGWRISDGAGLLALRPDTLLSSTAVAGAVFCRRKAVLQEHFRGLQPANTPMTIGILVHELLQLALQKRLCTVPDVQRALGSLLAAPSAVRLLYDAGLSREEAAHEMGTFVPQVVRFVDEHVVRQRPDGANKGRKADEWCGRVESVLDIEENIVSPQLGLKGKIDVTLLVNVHNRKGGPSEPVPLELKTGRASVSAEHRGQLIMYMMMMSLQSPSSPVSRGLLLYLRDIITLKVVSSGYPEQRDLLMLRNQLAQYLAPRTKDKPAQSEDSTPQASSETEESGTAELKNIDLPEPINHHACSKHTKSPALSQEHVLSRMRQEALGHLSEAHVQYFLRWTALLLLEELEKVSLNPLHHVWTRSPQERERRGRCLSELEVADVQPSGDRFHHTFVRPPEATDAVLEKEPCALAAGDYVVVSTAGKVWVAAGLITLLDPDVVCIALERDLRERNAVGTRYCADGYESQRQLGFNFTNLAALMDNDEKADRLRRLIIDRCEPEFSERLPREVGRLGARLLQPLNLLQQRAVLRAVAADHYTLVHGMPGTGKTQTVAVLVQMLVALGQKVLVTAHTHSAVDNVLLRLPQEMRVLRLGAAARVSPRLARRSEDALAARCTTPDELRALYDSMDVVGVTCLGAGHSLLTKRLFDVCIVDESTQVVQSTVLRPLLAARRFVLVGDPEQLPPLVRSALARKLGLDESLFARLQGGGATVSLSAQYRMNARVAALANRFAYGGRLACAARDVAEGHVPTDHQKLTELYSSSHPWLVDCLSPRADRSVLLLDTGCTAARRGAAGGGAGGRAASNAAEALVVLAIVKALFRAGLDPDSIGVITPYRDQVALLKRCVANLQKGQSPRRRSPRKNGDAAACVEVNTVDQYQGRDKSVIVYSCCKTWDPETGDYTVKDSEILEDKRRLTVAITRAKHKLIVIGDAAALKHYSTFGQLFRCLRELDAEEHTGSEIRLREPYDVLREELGGFL